MLQFTQSKCSEKLWSLHPQVTLDQPSTRLQSYELRYVCKSRWSFQSAMTLLEANAKWLNHVWPVCRVAYWLTFWLFWLDPVFQYVFRYIVSFRAGICWLEMGARYCARIIALKARRKAKTAFLGARDLNISTRLGRLLDSFSVTFPILKATGLSVWDGCSGELLW